MKFYKMSTTIKNILVPTDFSELSLNAITTGIAMCKRHDAALHLLHVVDKRYLFMPPGTRSTVAYLIPEPEKTDWEKMTKLKNEIEAKHNVNISAQLINGNPPEEIAKAAEELHCDLIVMGTHGASGLREFFIGSNAYAVIKHSSVPVLTVPGKKKVKDFKKILFPLRLSKAFTDKYDFLVPLIEKNNAELIIAGLSKPGEPDSLDPLNADVRELGRLLRLQKRNFTSAHYVCKNFAKKVLELSKKEKADLIVINASFDYDIKQFFIGPYTQQVVNHSTIPVLSYRTNWNKLPGEKPEK